MDENHIVLNQLETMLAKTKNMQANMPVNTIGNTLFQLASHQAVTNFVLDANISDIINHQIRNSRLFYIPHVIGFLRKDTIRHASLHHSLSTKNEVTLLYQLLKLHENDHLEFIHVFTGNGQPYFIKFNLINDIKQWHLADAKHDSVSLNTFSMLLNHPIEDYKTMRKLIIPASHHTMQALLSRTYNAVKSYLQKKDKKESR